MDGKMGTYSGHLYDYENPEQNTITLTDIAHHLSQTARFGGATREWVSVAEHSVLVHDILKNLNLSGRLCKAGLFHDAHEAYLWDIPSPLKPSIGDEFLRLADIADTAICEKMSIEQELFYCTLVKEADAKALNQEGYLFMPDSLGWESPVKAAEKAYSWRPGLPMKQAKALFLDRAAQYSLYEEHINRVPYAPPIPIINAGPKKVSKGGQWLVHDDNPIEHKDNVIVKDVPNSTPKEWTITYG